MQVQLYDFMHTIKDDELYTKTFYFIPLENCEHQHYFTIKHLYLKKFKALKKSEIIGKYMCHIFFLNSWKLENNCMLVKHFAFLTNGLK